MKVAVFQKPGTFTFRRPCGLKSIAVLDLRAKEGNEWKNGVWNTAILMKFPINSPATDLSIHRTILLEAMREAMDPKLDPNLR